MKQGFYGRIAGLLALTLCLFATQTLAADTHTVPGAPGLPHAWAPALKQAVGTAYEKTGSQSPLWFTVAQGVLTEVFYPHIDQPQVGDLQFLITDGVSYFSEQKRDAISEVKYSEKGAAVLIQGQERNGRYRFTQELVTDSHSPVVRIRTRLELDSPDLKVFVLFKPAINNNAEKNFGLATDEALHAWEEKPSFRGSRKYSDVHAALVSSLPWRATSVGYVGFSDGWQILSKVFNLTDTWSTAGPGNIALTAELQTNGEQVVEFDLALGFGENRSAALAHAKMSLQVPFAKIRQSYDQGWSDYLSSLVKSDSSAKSFLSKSAFARRSAIIVKMHEDKVRRGAIVASMSKPGIPDGDRSRGNLGGYHLVWPRDLYHAGMGLLAAGDTQTPIDVLKFLFETQHADGSWSQNFWIDGTPYWTGLQLDEVAFPILLAWQLEKRGIYHLSRPEREMIARAAWFVANHGPSSPQDRWEEIGGYIPSTLASEIAALWAAHRLTGEERFNEVAQSWSEQLENWTLVQHGPLGTNYYIRVSLTGDANRPEHFYIANNGGGAWTNEILDGGFLDLARLGVRSAHDPNLVSTLQKYEDPSIGVATNVSSFPGAQAYRRYNRDAYGLNRVGGFWPLLAGERGHFAILQGDMARARLQLQVLEAAALPSGNLPEQVVGGTVEEGAGLGVATPLVWAHAEDLRLHRSIEEARVFDAP